MTPEAFKTLISRYHRKHRRNMPWRATRSPYRILVSEVMLQQTQVARVMKHYPVFIRQFPDFRALARAKTRDVLGAWQGLGYNRRAISLQKLSSIVVEDFEGALPRDRAILESLPGIGKATAGSVRAFAFGEPDVFIETNIRRVFIHFFFPKRKKVTDALLERYIERTLDRKNPREWYYALMDYGAELGALPLLRNPNRRSAHYRRQSAFKGSGRELRGKILRVLLRDGDATLRMLAVRFGEPAERIRAAAEGLSKEGFVTRRGETISIS